MRSKLSVAIVALALLLVAGAVGLYAYDDSREDRIARGVTVGGIDIGGLRAADARRRLERELVAPLREPVVVEARDRRFRLTAERAGVEADVDAMVDEALERSRDGSVLTRTWRSLTGGDVDADWESAYATGDEAPGGDNPTPDQDRVDDIGRAIGVEYQDNEELKASDKVAERDRHRWELDPASSEDYTDRD